MLYVISGRNSAYNPAVDYYFMVIAAVRQFPGQCLLDFDRLVSERWVEGIW